MILNEYWREQSHYLGQSVCRPAMPFIKVSMKLIVRYEKPKAGSYQSGRKQHSNPSLTLVEPIHCCTNSSLLHKCFIKGNIYVKASIRYLNSASNKLILDKLRSHVYKQGTVTLQTYVVLLMCKQTIS